VLYKEAFPGIKSYVLKNSGDRELSEDLFHDVVIKLILKVRKEELPENTDVHAYLFTMAKNFWITKAKRDTKLQFSSEILDFDLSVPEEMETHKNEKSVLMAELLESLGNMCRDLLKLTFYKDCSLKEAAEKLNISNAEVAKTYQYRCKKKLFEAIKSNNTYRELMEV
jgi:RNA polymerase sigma factor (sigma-70 family)